MSELSRRGFLKLGGGVVAGAGVALAGVAVPESAEAAVHESVDRMAGVSDIKRDDALAARQANVSSFIAKVSDEV